MADSHEEVYREYKPEMMDSHFSKELAEFLKKHSSSSSEKVRPEELEELFIQALNHEDLKTLGLPHYLAPEIGRGLPKFYSQVNPAICRVKENFSDAALLRRLRIEKAIFFLYGQQEFSRRAKIALFTWVIADGIGDYFAQMEAAHVLCEKFPGLYLISLLHKDCPALPSHPKCLHYSLRYSGKLNCPIIHEAFSVEILTHLSQSDLLLEIPTAFPFMGSLLEEVKKNNPTLKYERIGEHSLIESRDFQPLTGAHCMGLHPLEMGIFSKRNSFRKDSDILQLQYPPLLQLLLPSRTPKGVEDYLQSHTFNVAYTKTFRGTSLYLHTLFKGLAENPKDIDICFFNLELMLKVFNERFKRGEEWKIGKVLIYVKNHVTPILISNGHKTLRMIHCPPLAQQDMHTLFCNTEHLIGCTGDQTLCEAIRSGVPFFYDPPHFKRAILKDLSVLAATRVSYYPAMSHFFQILLKNPHISREKRGGEWVSEDHIQREEDGDEKIGDALASLFNGPGFKESFVDLAEILQREYSFEPLLEGIVNRALFHRNFPSLMQWEQEALDEFSKKKSTAVDFLKLLKEKILLG
jgi:hypothetical protein